MKPYFLFFLALLSAIGATGCADESTVGSDEAAIDFRFELDALNYEHRERVLDLLIAKHPLSAVPDPREGKRQLTRWQADSGRSAYEWWSVLNFRIVLGEFLMLQERGEFRQIRLVVPEGPHWRITDEERQAQRAVYDLYDRIETLSKAGRAKEAFGLERELRKAFWKAHDVALAEGLRDLDVAFAKLPTREAQFAGALTQSLEPIMSALLAPCDDLVFVEKGFPDAVLTDDVKEQGLRAFFLRSLEVVHEVEGGQYKPLRSAARFVEGHSTLEQVDAVSSKVNAFLTADHGSVTRWDILGLFR